MEDVEKVSQPLSAVSIMIGMHKNDNYSWSNGVMATFTMSLSFASLWNFTTQTYSLPEKEIESGFIWCTLHTCSLL